MNLPRNIVQIGEPDKYHKIFVEDYVLSYLKQCVRRNRETLNAYGRIGPKMVLYGKRQEENDITYYFLYEAALLTEVSEKEDYLTQEERRETEEIRNRFFTDNTFMAFCTLGDDLPEGFYVLEGIRGRFVSGYACFYEKNDNMLSYMLYKKETEQPAEEAEQKSEPQEEVLKKAAVTHRAVPVKKGKEPVAKGVKTPFRTGAMWVIAALCIIGITAINDKDKLINWKDALVRGFESIGEQKLPDREAVDLPDRTVEAGSDKVVSDASAPHIQNMVSENQMIIDAEKKAEAETDKPEELEEQTQPPVQETVQVSESYVIQRGDTLLSISREKYGTVEKVKEICELNQITNPDSIQIGQTILLP